LNLRHPCSIFIIPNKIYASKIAIFIKEFQHDEHDGGNDQPMDPVTEKGDAWKYARSKKAQQPQGCLTGGKDYCIRRIYFKPLIFCICPIIYNDGLDIADVQLLRGVFDMELRSGQVKCADFVFARN
jgi:hypothetical protein